MELIRQYEIAMSWDCYGLWLGLTRLVGASDAELEAADAAVLVPAAVRIAYQMPN